MATKADNDNPELLTTMNAIGYHGQIIEATEKHQLFAFDDASIKLLLQLDIAPTKRARCGISVKPCA